MACWRLGVRPSHHPIHASEARAHGSEEHLTASAAAFIELEADGMAPRNIAQALMLLVEELESSQRMDDRIELVFAP